MLDLSYGPFTYLIGSNEITTHHVSSLVLNSLFGELNTDCNILPSNEWLPVIGKRGSLVLSDQTGIHFGYPQETGRRRVVATTLLRPVSCGYPK